MRVELPLTHGFRWFTVATIQAQPGTWLRISFSSRSPSREYFLASYDASCGECSMLVCGNALRSHAPRALMYSDRVPAVRYTQRAEALGTLYKQLTAGAIWLTAAILLLHELRVALATVVTGAGFLGVAVALGAQDLLRDYVAGFVTVQVP